MGEQKVVHLIRNHLRYVYLEGWKWVEYRLFKSEKPDEFVICLEYWTDEGERGGEFWHAPAAEFDEVLEMILGLSIPRKKELPPPAVKGDSPEIEAHNAAWREGYREGYNDAISDELGRDPEEGREGDEWKD